MLFVKIPYHEWHLFIIGRFFGHRFCIRSVFHSRKPHNLGNNWATINWIEAPRLMIHNFNCEYSHSKFMKYYYLFDALAYIICTILNFKNRFIRWTVNFEVMMMKFSLFLLLLVMRRLCILNGHLTDLSVDTTASHG